MSNVEVKCESFKFIFYRLLRVSYAQSKKQRRIIGDENNTTVGNEVEVLQVKECQEELTKWVYTY